MILSNNTCNIKHTLLLMLASITIVFTLVTCNNTKKDTNISHEVIATGTKAIQLDSLDILIDNSEYDTLLHNTDANLLQLLSLLPKEYILLSYETINLNSDDIDEYVLLYMTGEKTEIKVVIAAFDTGNSKYNFVWQSNTNTVSKDSNLVVKDITGDFNNEIIIIGSNSNKERIIDVFKMKGNDLTSFTNIFTKSATSIELIEQSSQQYLDEYAISTLTQIIANTTSPNNDTLSAYYQWDNVQGVIKLISQEKILNNKLAKDKISELRKADDNTLLNFLSGAWIEDNSTSDTKSSTRKYLFFSPLNQQVVMYEGAEALVYRWTSSYGSISYKGGVGIQINMKSNILPSVYDWIHLEILSDKSIYIIVNENLPVKISGLYNKIDSEQEIIDKINPYNNTLKLSKSSETYLTKFFGVFENVKTNTNYIFDFPRLQIINDQEKIDAYYNIVDIANNSVIEIKKGNTPEFYIISTESDEDNTFKLVPIHVYADAYYNINNKNILELKKILTTN